MKVGYKGIHQFLGSLDRWPLGGPVSHSPGTGQILTSTRLCPLPQITHQECPIEDTSLGPSQNSMVLSESFQQSYQHLDLTHAFSFSTKACCFPELPPNGFHNSWLFWTKIKLQCRLFTSDFLGKPQMIFSSWVESHNPEKLPVRSTLCPRGKEKWPLCVCLEMAPSWDRSQLCLCPGPKPWMEGPQLHPAGDSSTQILGSQALWAWRDWILSRYSDRRNMHKSSARPPSECHLWVVCSQKTSIFFFMFIGMLFENNHVLLVSFESILFKNMS